MMNSKEIVFEPTPTIHNFKRLDGMIFGRLTVLGYAGKVNSRAYWWCECACSEIVKVRSASLVNGVTQSCGCFMVDRAREANTKHGGALFGDLTPEYRTWRSMKRRCYDPKHQHYHYYGGRGIKVCDRWLESFDNFLTDMGPSPSLQHSIDRKNGDEDYTPQNCRWATTFEQNNNRSNTIRITIAGRTQALADWCRDRSVRYETVAARLARGWTPEESLGIVERPLLTAKRRELLRNQAKVKTLEKFGGLKAVGK